MDRPIEFEILTNEERRYFGLEPIRAEWERFEVKPGFWVYFEGDVIRKTIFLGTLPGEKYKDFLEYAENDNEIYTRERRVVLARTQRGKEKKLNYTSISAMRPTGCSFWMNLSRPGLGSELVARNTRNCVSLPIVFPRNVDTLAAFRKWMDGFIAACPPGYFEKVERMKHTKHRTVKYFNGDIFRFEIDLEHYGFGLIIGQIGKMDKDGLLKEEHILGSTLGVCLLVRLYLLKTVDRDMRVENITAHPLGRTFIMMDNQVIWGEYEIVGSKRLEEADIDFPIQAGRSLSARNRGYVRLCWGLGIIVRDEKGNFPKPLMDNRLLRHGCYFGVNRLEFERALESGPVTGGLDELEQIAFAYFEVPKDTTFDAFNRLHGGMTRAEYAAYANRFGREIENLMER